MKYWENVHVAGRTFIQAFANLCLCQSVPFLGTWLCLHNSLVRVHSCVINLKRLGAATAGAVSKKQLVRLWRRTYNTRLHNNYEETKKN